MLPGERSGLLIIAGMAAARRCACFADIPRCTGRRGTGTRRRTVKALVTAGADVYGADSKGYVGGGASLSSWRACRSLPVPGEVQRLSDCLYGTGACCACGPRCIRRRRRGTRRQRRRLWRRARTCASRTAAGTTAPGKRALLCFADYSRDTGVRLMCRRTALSSGCEESAHGDGDGVCGGGRGRALRGH